MSTQHARPTGAPGLRTPLTAPGRVLLDLVDQHLPQIRVGAEDNDRHSLFPTETFEAFGKDGLMGATVPAELGGLGVDHLHDVATALASVASADASTALAWHVQLCRGLTLAWEWRHGREPVRVLAEQLLRSMAGGKAAVCGAVKDHPTGVTVLTRDNSGRWSLSGCKTLVSMAPIGTHFFVHAQTKAEGEPPALGVVLLSRDTPGLSVLDDWEGLGMRASGTADVAFDQCPVDASNVVSLRPAGDHNDAVLAGQTVSSITMLGVYTGIAQAARDIAAARFLGGHHAARGDRRTSVFLARDRRRGPLRRRRGRRRPHHRPGRARPAHDDALPARQDDRQPPVAAHRQRQPHDRRRRLVLGVPPARPPRPGRPCRLVHAAVHLCRRRRLPQWPGAAAGQGQRLRQRPVGVRCHRRRVLSNRKAAMTTRVWDYLPEYGKERVDILDAVETVFGSGQLVLGASVRGFEDEFAAYHGGGHCTGVDNGTNALVLALEALGVGHGDEVITVSNTAAPTIVAIASVGATPVFVDVCENDYLMDTGLVADAITPRTKALLPVHLYGQCVDMVPLRRLADQHGLALLEDCAQAHGARQHGRLAGTTGNAAAFSFYPTKVLGAYGDGGAVLTRDDDIDRSLRRLRYYGMEKTYYVVGLPGHNSRLDEVQAEILRRKLRRLDDYIAARNAIAERYAEGLASLTGPGGLVLPAVRDGNDHVYYLYVVRHPRRDEIIERLQEHDIELNVSYRWPVHTMTGFAHLGYAPGSLPVTERLADEIFSLPMYPSLPRDRQDRVIEALHDVLAPR
jgi:aminotransferase EvaB